jgi:dihydrodipicolinate synthase/N-acetylneuraminate lyase
VLRGTLAATVTPLRDGGDRLHTDAFPPYLDFLASAGVDGIFVLGTTGEGVLLSVEQRKRAAEFFAAGPLGVIVHCGAQTTRETMELASHASDLGVEGVAVVGPPYYAFDERALVVHFLSAAAACWPTPFYLYEFEARSGYAIPLTVVERLRDEAPNFTGLKVSDSPFDRVEPYIVEGLDVFIGAEALLPEGLARGAAGSVSGLAAAFPEPVVELVRNPSEEARARVVALRDALQQAPFIPAAKRALALRGVPVREHVRAPLRRLTDEERTGVDAAVAEWLESQSPAPAR